MAKKLSITAVVRENSLSRNPLGPTELAQKYGLKLTTVERTIARLRDRGTLPRNPNSPTSNARPDKTGGLVVVGLPPGSLPKKPSWTLDDVGDIAHIEVMDELSRLKILSQMARFGVDTVRVAAIKALEELQRGRGSTIGPPVPLNDEERIVRLSRLMLAIGPELTAIAQQRAFEMLQEASVELPQETSPLDAGPSVGNSDVDRLNAPIE